MIEVLKLLPKDVVPEIILFLASIEEETEDPSVVEESVTIDDVCEALSGDVDEARCSSPRALMGTRVRVIASLSWEVLLGRRMAQGRLRGSRRAGERHPAHVPLHGGEVLARKSFQWY
jgi:hypothetical protein